MNSKVYKYGKEDVSRKRLTPDEQVELTCEEFIKHLFEVFIEEGSIDYYYESVGTEENFLYDLLSKVVANVFICYVLEHKTGHIMLYNITTLWSKDLGEFILNTPEELIKIRGKKEKWLSGEVLSLRDEVTSDKLKRENFEELLDLIDHREY